MTRGLGERLLILEDGEIDLTSGVAGVEVVDGKGGSSEVTSGVGVEEEGGNGGSFESEVGGISGSGDEILILFLCSFNNRSPLLISRREFSSNPILLLDNLESIILVRCRRGLYLSSRCLLLSESASANTSS